MFLRERHDRPLNKFRGRKGDESLDLWNGCINFVQRAKLQFIMYKKNYLKTVLFYFFVLLWGTSLQTWGQIPTVSLTLDKTSISEAGGKATLTATLSAPHSRDVTVYLKTAGSAAYQGDYEADFVGKGTAKTVAGGNGRGSAANQLSSPRGIFVDSQGNLFIADEVNSRIQKWALGATLGITVAGGNGYGF